MSYFLETLYGILGEGAYYRNFTVFVGHADTNEKVKKANKRLHYLRDYRKAQLPPDVGTTAVYCTKIRQPTAVLEHAPPESSKQKSRHHRHPH